MNSAEEWRLVLLAAGAAFTLVGVASRKEPRRAAAFILAWLLPGAGHVAMGKWKKGLFFLLLLGATYLFGLWIVGFRAVAFDENPFYYVGQYGSGATFLVGRLLADHRAFPREDLPPSWYDPGLLYVCVAGLLNVVLMLNVLELPVPRRPESAPPAAGTAAPAVAAPAAEGKSSEAGP
jgi:hypothetical protein